MKVRRTSGSAAAAPAPQSPLGSTCEVQQMWLARMVTKEEFLTDGLPKSLSELPDNLVPTAAARAHTLRARTLSKMRLNLSFGKGSPASAAGGDSPARSSSMSLGGSEDSPYALTRSDSAQMPPRARSTSVDASMLKAGGSAAAVLSYRSARTAKDSSRFEEDGAAEAASGGALHPALGRARGLDVVQAHQVVLRQEQDARRRAEAELEAMMLTLAELEAELMTATARVEAEREAAVARTASVMARATAEREAAGALASQLGRAEDDARSGAESSAAEREGGGDGGGVLMANAELAVVTAAMTDLDAELHAATACSWHAARQLQAEKAARARAEAALEASEAAARDQVAGLELALEAARAEARDKMASTERSIRAQLEAVEREAALRLAVAASEMSGVARSKEEAAEAFQVALRSAKQAAADEATREKEAALERCRDTYEHQLAELQGALLAAGLREDEEMEERAEEALGEEEAVEAELEAMER